MTERTALPPHENLDAGTRVPRRRVWWAVVWIALAGLYVVTAVGNRSGTDDAFAFASVVERGSVGSLFDSSHLPHLIYLPLWRGLRAVAMTIGIDASAYEVALVGNSFVMAAAVVLLWAVLRFRLRLNPLAAGLSAAGFASSFAVLRYANEADAYPIAFLSLGALAWVALAERDDDVRWIVLTACVGALAALVHIMGLVAAIAFPPVLLLLRRRFRSLIVYGATLGVVLVLATFGAFLVGARPGQSYAQYLAVGGGTGLRPEAFGLSLIGFPPDLVASDFLFGFPGFSAWLAERVPTMDLRAEIFLASRWQSLFRVAAPVTAVVSAVLGVVLIVKAVLARAAPIDRRTWAFGAWVLLYWVVAAGRSPATPEAWIPVLLPIWILIGLFVLARIGGRSLRTLGVGFVSVLLLHNLAVGIWPLRSPAGDLNAQKAAWLVANAEPGDTILTSGGTIFERYLGYRSKARVVALEYRSGPELDAVLAGALAGDGKVFVTDDVLVPGPGLRELDPDSFEAILAFGADLELSEVASGPAGSTFEVVGVSG